MTKVMLIICQLGLMQQKLFRLYNVSIQFSLYCQFRIANFNSEFKEEIIEYFKHRFDELFKYQKLFVTIFWTRNKNCEASSRIKYVTEGTQTITEGKIQPLTIL